MNTPTLTQAVAEALKHDSPAQRELLETFAECGEEALAAAAVIRGLVESSPATLYGLMLDLLRESDILVTNAMDDLELALIALEASAEEWAPDANGACDLVLAHIAAGRLSPTYPHAA